MHLGAASVNFLYQVERLIGCEGFAAYQVQTNSEWVQNQTGSEGAGAKVRVRKEKNPAHRLRSPNRYSVALTKFGYNDS
ncbi:hypothetical protein FACS189440_21800 [Bacteroidia bacterium]|nr:hypothetical protein FACS189440_21800 [Bacteroidia bacterium]